MSTDIRRCGKEDLDRMNLEIARYKATRGGQSVTTIHDNVINTKAEQGTNENQIDNVILITPKADQLDLFL
jgi:hypothetical protein